MRNSEYKFFLLSKVKLNMENIKPLFNKNEYLIVSVNRFEISLEQKNSFAYILLNGYYSHDEESNDLVFINIIKSSNPGFKISDEYKYLTIIETDEYDCPIILDILTKISAKYKGNVIIDDDVHEACNLEKYIRKLSV